jgi:hypothetical protein
MSQRTDLTGAHAYPRPQLERAVWSSLNGQWQFALDRDPEWRRPQDVRWNRTIVVRSRPKHLPAASTIRAFPGRRAAAFPGRFAEYCYAIARYIAARIDEPPAFTPLNEPSYFAWAAGDAALFAPHHQHRGWELKIALVRQPPSPRHRRDELLLEEPVGVSRHRFRPGRSGCAASALARPGPDVAYEPALAALADAQRLVSACAQPAIGAARAKSARQDML